jgi:uncharacterized BrkB/YihY/UPF0761 family membrane protein
VVAERYRTPPQQAERALLRQGRRKGDAVSRQANGDARKFPGWIANVKQHRQRYQDKLERRPWIAFPLESLRRFKKIEGKHLALVIALNLFVAVIPLMIIGYAFIEAFNPDRDVGNLLVENLHLTGSTANIVEDTFANASSGKSVALSISLISLLITGLDVSATAQIAYARAFTVTPLRGIQKYLRGAAWLILLLADTGAALTLRSLATHHPLGFALAAGAALLVLEFGFFLVTPRLLLDLPFNWRDLVPGAAVCTAAATVVHIVAAFFLRNWVGAYGHAYGGFGVSLALAAFVGIIASFWVWIAAVMGVWWERKAGPAAVAAMEELGRPQRVVSAQAVTGTGQRAGPLDQPTGVTSKAVPGSTMTDTSQAPRCGPVAGEGDE